MREIILCTIGTRGDFLPFHSLAKELSARGHRVTFVANENWREETRDIASDFFALAGKDTPQSDRNDYLFFKHHVLPASQKSFDYIKGKVSNGDRPLIVSRSNMLGVECAAEKFKLDHVRIALQPAAIRSLERPPWPWTQLAEGRTRWLFRVVAAPILLFSEAFGRYRRLTNSFRRTAGLHPIRFQWLRNVGDSTILLCPKWFSMPASDWPASCVCVGFPFVTGEACDPSVIEFIEQKRPLVFTPGTGVTAVDPFLKNALTTCQQLELPGLFLSASLPKGVHMLAENFMCSDYADLGRVLPNARLLVHHGGIGSTAQAIRAGIPQIVIPDRFDQPDNAMRIAKLRLGGAIMEKNASSASWIKLAKMLIGQSQVTERLEKVSAATRQSDGIKRAADLIEQNI